VEPNGAGAGESHQRVAGPYRVEEAHSLLPTRGPAHTSMLVVQVVQAYGQHGKSGSSEQCRGEDEPALGALRYGPYTPDPPLCSAMH
jgi:hypothetical protein